MTGNCPSFVRENHGSGEPLGGKHHGGLTDCILNKCTAYYRNAVQNNLGSVKDMKNAIYATFYHCSRLTTSQIMKSAQKAKSHGVFFFKRTIANIETLESRYKMIETPLAEHLIKQIQPIYEKTCLRLCARK